MRLLSRGMARGILFYPGNLLIYVWEPFIRAPDLLISFLDRCDCDILWISLFRVRHGIHLAHLVRLTSLPEGRPSAFHKADELPGFYQSIAAMESIGLENQLAIIRPHENPNHESKVRDANGGDTKCAATISGSKRIRKLSLSALTFK